MANSPDAQKLIAAEHIVTLTTGYSPLHDRIHLISRTETGALLNLWLTHRIANPLVEHLLFGQRPWSTTDLETTTQTGKSQIEDRTASGVLEANHQAEISGEILVEAVDVALHPESVALQFRGAGSDEKALLILGDDTLSQWLQGLRCCYQLASWPDTPWSGVNIREIPYPRSKPEPLH